MMSAHYGSEVCFLLTLNKLNVMNHQDLSVIKLGNKTFIESKFISSQATPLASQAKVSFNIINIKLKH